MSEKSYKILTDLLPEGKILTPRRSKNLRKFIKVLAKSFDRIFDNIYILESDREPRTSDNLIERWVNRYEIDDDLDKEIKRGFAQSYLTSIGGQSSDYFLQQLRLTGYTIDLVESRTHVAQCGISKVGQAQLRGFGYLAFVYYESTDEKEAEVKRVLEKLVLFYKPAHINIEVKRK